MKVKELLNLLSQMPSELDVVVKGYESGVDDVINVQIVNIKKGVHSQWYYGRHELDEGSNVQAVYIQREERDAEK